MKTKITGNRNKDKAFGVSKRETLAESSKSSMTPGPGHYSQGMNGEANEWYKKTFNYRYLKQFH